MKIMQSETTLTTLANGAELVAAIARGVLGNELPDTVNGSPMNRIAVYSIAHSVFQTEISNCMGGIKNVNS